MPDALRTTSPPAAIWTRTALGKTFWTVVARGFDVRDGDAASRGGATRTSHAASAAVPRVVNRRVLSTSPATDEARSRIPARGAWAARDRASAGATRCG